MGVLRRQQKVTRKGHIKLVVKCLAKKLGCETEQARMISTDRVLPLGSLRRSCVRNLFTGWIVRLVGQGRILTKKLTQQVLIELRRKFDLPIGNPEEHKEEINRLHCLLKASRKQQLGNPRVKPAMSFIDNLDTQPMDADGLHSDNYAQDPFCISLCLVGRKPE